MSEEIIGAKSRIEDAVGVPVEAFAYPYGAHNHNVRALVASEFSLACATALGFVGSGSDPFALERLDMYYLRRLKLFARLFTRACPEPAPNGLDHLDLIELEFSRDLVAHITLDRLSRGRHRYLDIRLDGEAGSIETSLGGRLEGRVGVRPATRRPFFSLDVAMGGRARLFHGERFSVLAKEPLNVFAAATCELMRAFLIALERGEIPPCNAADNRHTLALMLGAYEADAKRMPIALGSELSVTGQSGASLVTTGALSSRTNSGFPASTKC